MKAFNKHQGIVLPLDRANVDTDAILPKQYLKSIQRDGFGGWLFDDDRYLDEGSMNIDLSCRRPNKDFILNVAKYEGCSILLTRDNFGCGSSREQAVWALRDYGFRVIIAPSYADIFYNNCFKNGLLPVVLSCAKIDVLFALATAEQTLSIGVDLQRTTIEIPESTSWLFSLDEGRQQNLLHGKDEIAYTLEHSGRIRDFEAEVYRQEPWLKPTGI